ncbi:Vitamin B12 ABC transporter, permease component BtuC [Clostridiaceae bacterium JG1575]|nr:Vitamin B12 ABC transporter, permease component BtuC [Clostridiaceae bacterium JG1575]
MNPKRAKQRRVFMILLLLLLLLALLSITLGDARIGVFETFELLGRRLRTWVLGESMEGGVKGVILLQIRIPRIVGAAFVGAGLSVVGCAYQGVFRNPMADPYILGISSGATLGAALTISLGATGTLWGFGAVTLGAFLGALGATFLVYALALRRRSQELTALLLSGIAVSYLLSALVSLILVFDERNVSRIVYWTMGSFAGVGYPQLALLIPVTLLGSALLWTKWRPLDILSSGEEVARSLGVDPRRVKIQIMITSSLVVAVAVAFTGTIGFVGLMMPHIMRMVVGPSHRRLMPFSMMAGALFLLLADTLARSALSGAELPVGAVTALFGAPYFLVLLLRRKKGEGS